MFEKFYTTKMSTNGRELRLRFEKIRRGRGRFTRLAGSVMAAVMLITLACATIAMAAVGTDRPEHWDKNEYYYVCGMNFSIDVSGAAVPEWVNALAGGSGKLEISLSKCQMRDTKGYVSNSYLGSFAGEGDSVLFEAQAWTVAPDGDEPYVAEYCGNFENMTNNFNIVPDDGRRARMTFGVDENKLIDSVKVEFFAEQPLSVIDYGKKAETVFVPEHIDIIGDYDRSYIDQRNLVSDSASFFLNHEMQNYRNKSVNGIDVSVESAGNDSIRLRLSKPDTVKNIRAYVYNPDMVGVSDFMGYEISENGYETIVYNNNRNSEIASDGTAITFFAPKTVHREGLYGICEEEKSGSFISGKTYLVELAMLDEAETIIYRWLDYVTMP